MTRTLPLVMIVVLAISLRPSPVRAQQPIAVVTLPPASATSTETFGAILGIRELPGGKLLVDDAGRRQIKLLEATLASSMTVIDSASGTSRSYGRRPAPLIPYLGDSTMFPDYVARTVIVLDGRGDIGRSLAMPTATDVGNLSRGAAIDPLGRLIYLGSAPTALQTVAGQPAGPADSVPVLRADFERRRTDTLGYLSRPLGKTSAKSPDNSTTLTVWTVDPLRTIDEWTVLSDGSVALVRGHDYHIDWVRPDGAKASSAKLAFDWKRVTDADKQRIIDSTRDQLSAAIANGSFIDRVEMVNVIRGPAANRGGAPAASGGGRAAGGSPGFAGFTIVPSDVISVDQVADYYPAIRAGAAIADLDGNAWILPTTSTQSKQGELVYDIVNSSGHLFQRVRVPLGRLVVGFGRGGVVYMTSGSRATGFHLERSTLPAKPSN